MNDSTSISPTITIEEWRDIPGHEERYQVSNLGRVRSKNFRVKHSRWPGQTRPVYGKILKQSFCGGPYLVIGIKEQGKKHTTKVEVHRLVAAAFIGPCPPKHHTHHKDTDKSNNVASNLEYLCIPDHNRTHFSGKAGNAHKLTSEQVAQIREAQGVSQEAIGKMFGVSQTMVGLIKRGLARRYD